MTIYHILPKGYQRYTIGTYVFRGSDQQAWHMKQYRHRPWNAFHQPILDSSLLPHEHQSSTLNCLPPAAQRLDPAAEPDHGTIPPRLQQQRAGQLGRTPSSGIIRVHPVSACFDSDDTVLGHVPSEPQDAVQCTESVTPKIGAPSGCYAQLIGRDSPDSP